MSYADTRAFCEARQRAETPAGVQERLAALEAGKGECPTCVQRRAGDAERQRRSRQRHVPATAEMSMRAGPGAA